MVPLFPTPVLVDHPSTALTKGLPGRMVATATDERLVTVMTMAAHKKWDVTLEFRVPKGDEEAELCSDMLDHAARLGLPHLSSFVGGANHVRGTAEISFTVYAPQNNYCPQEELWPLIRSLGATFPKAVIVGYAGTVAG